MKYQLATIFVCVALLLDTMSYVRQIAKTVRTKKSSQVSAMSFVYKVAKVMFSIAGLAIYSNMVGVSMEVFMLLVYLFSLSVIIRYKPKNWGLWK